MIHTDLGPYLIGVWYRPPGNEMDGINSLPEELNEWRPQALGTVLLGDMNVHNEAWLRFSSHTSAAGRALQLMAKELGLRQKSYQADA